MAQRILITTAPDCMSTSAAKRHALTLVAYPTRALAMQLLSTASFLSGTLMEQETGLSMLPETIQQEFLQTISALHLNYFQLLQYR